MYLAGVPKEKSQKTFTVQNVSCLMSDIFKQLFPHTIPHAREIFPEMTAKYNLFFEQSLASAHFYFLMYQTR